jgi:acyl-CoA thioesterase-1
VLRYAVVSVLVAIGWGAPIAPVQGAQPAVNVIAVLGDSLAISPRADAAFPAVLGDQLDDRDLSWRVKNFSVRGDTTAGGVRRLAGVLSERPAILIVALGANDGLRGIDTVTIARNIDEIITRARGAGVRVLLCGMETPPLRGWAYTVAFHNIFPALAKQHAVPLVPFLLAGVALDPELNMEDMIHPNEAGARRIADTIWPLLEPMLTVGHIAARRR